MRVAGLAESLPCARPHRRRAAFVRIPPYRREAAEDADCPNSGKHGKVVAVHLIFQGCLAKLIEAPKLERNPASVGEDQAVETNSEPRLILVCHGLSRADNSRASRDQDALPIRRVEGNGNHGQHRAGEVAGKLCCQHRFQKRAFVNPLPTRRVLRHFESRWNRVISRRGAGRSRGGNSRGRFRRGGRTAECRDKRLIRLRLRRDFIFQAACDRVHCVKRVLQGFRAFIFCGCGIINDPLPGAPGAAVQFAVALCNRRTAKRTAAPLDGFQAQALPEFPFFLGVGLSGVGTRPGK